MRLRVGARKRTSGCTARSVSACGSRSEPTSTDAASAISACAPVLCASAPAPTCTSTPTKAPSWSAWRVDVAEPSLCTGFCQCSPGCRGAFRLERHTAQPPGVWTSAWGWDPRDGFLARREAAARRSRRRRRRRGGGGSHRCAAANEHGLPAPLDGDGGALRDIAQVHLHRRQRQHVLRRLLLPRVLPSAAAAGRPLQV